MLKSMPQYVPFLAVFVVAVLAWYLSWRSGDPVIATFVSPKLSHRIIESAAVFGFVGSIMSFLSDNLLLSVVGGVTCMIGAWIGSWLIPAEGYVP